MARDLQGADLVGRDVVCLVTVSFAGREWLFSTAPVEVTSRDGTETRHFHGGLQTPEIEETLAGIAEVSEPLSVACEVDWPGDLALLQARGHDLASAEAEVALYTTGAWEDRQVMVRGSCRKPAYGALGEPVVFSVEANTYDDGALLPPSTARVTPTTYPSAPDEAELLYYPIPIGSPGAYTSQDGTSGTTSGSPALVVARSGADATKLLIALGEVEATSVLIFDSTTSESFSVTTEEDGLGRLVSVVDLSGASTIDVTEDEFWVGWNNGGGILKRDRSGPIELGGDLLEWAFEQSTLQVDRGRMAAAKPLLNRYKFADFIETQTSPWDWVKLRLLPVLPMTLVVGPDGVYPLVWRLDATAEESLEHVVVRPGITRVAPVRAYWDERDLRNELRFEYSFRQKKERPKRVLTYAGNANTAADEQRGNLIAELSFRRHGTRAKTFKLENVYDDATIGKIAADQLRLRGLAHRVTVYQVGPRLARLAPGSLVLWSDAELSIERQLAVIERRRWLPVGAQLRVLFLEDPVRDGRASAA